MLLLGLLLLVAGYDLLYTGVKGYTLPDGTRTFNPWYPITEAIGGGGTSGTSSAPATGGTTPAPSLRPTAGTVGLLSRVPSA